ncbi:hypothetical protein AJ80_00852 [Polytolypa hystricis UAMH7299]|uniref:Proteinase inhibitor I78 n=1 Tax=Polytolypa hystricis (strain UAMH7299) TaxID=1447883 RepID=A0A2B7YTK9_POLH7|nr:hypothetical protein AJ80_00852 [Polytolypa hystricis UAMH7299]
MPLVVPQISADDKADWASKLLGKKLTENTTDTISFATKDLPKEHRVVEPGMMVTMDHKPDRLNVHVNEDGTVTEVKYG